MGTIIPHGTWVPIASFLRNPEYLNVLIANTDNLMDATSEITTNPEARDAAMRRAHRAGHRACEVCGKALKGEAVLVAGNPVGPDCAKRLAAAGFSW